MPFQNMTNDTTWNVWQNGIQDMLITTLSNLPDELKVRQSESINQIDSKQRNLPIMLQLLLLVASTISQKLDANLFIYGSIKQAGLKLRIYAQLIDYKDRRGFKIF